MGFRRPVATIDPVARQAAGNAQQTANNAQQTATSALAVANGKNTTYLSATAPTAPAAGFTAEDTWVDTTAGVLKVWTGSAWTAQQWGSAALSAGSVLAGTIAAGAINGQTITGALIRTAAAGQRVQLDSTNGLVAVNAAGTAVTQIRPTDGVLLASGAVIAGELNTAAAGAARVRVFPSTDGKGNPRGVIALEDGVSGDTAAQVFANAYAGGGGGLTVAGGTYLAPGITKPAPTLVLQTDQANLSTVSVTAPDGLFLNGTPVATIGGDYAYQLQNFSYSFGIPLAWTTLPGCSFSVTIPPGRILEVFWDAPRVVVNANAEVDVRLQLNGAVRRALQYNTGASATTSPGHMETSYGNSGSAAVTIPVLVEATCSGGGGSINSGQAAPVELTWRLR